MHVVPVGSGRAGPGSSFAAPDSRKEKPEPYVLRTLRTNNAFAIALTVLFFSIELACILRHEMWLDEIQAWLVARDSTSIADLLHNVRYERATALWHILLYFITRFARNPWWMQMCHLLIATATVFILAKFSPFTKIQRALFVFGYFPFYEYAIISRNYALGLLLVTLICVFMRAQRKRYLVLGCLTFLLAHTSAFGLILAIAVGIAVFVDYVFQFPLEPPHRFNLACGLLVFLAGVVTATLYLIAPIDYNSGLSFGFLTSTQHQSVLIRWVYAVMDIWNGYVPIPNVYVHALWNTNIVDILHHDIWFKLLPACILAAYAVKCLIHRPSALALYVSGTAGITMFSVLFYHGYVRHIGHLYIVLIAALWLAGGDAEPAPHPASQSLGVLSRWIRIASDRLIGWKCGDRAARAFITSILVANVIAGVTLMGMDWQYPFSQAEEVAEFIRSHSAPNTMVAGYPDFIASPISAYLNRPVYSVNRNAMQTFAVWDTKREHNLDVENTLRKILDEGRNEIWLVSDSLFTNGPEIDVSDATAFRDSLNGDIFYLHLLRKAAP